MAEAIQYRVQVSTWGGDFRHVIEPFIVPTPVPYVVDLAHQRDETSKDAAKARLIESCQHLYDILTLLGISLKDARDANYTLNLGTRDRLLHIAWDTENKAAAEKIHARQW